MGSGEFEGGGSVKWEVINTDGESGNGNKRGAKGKDKDPKGPNGVFVVTVTGHAPIIAKTKGTRVTVVWGEPSDANDSSTTASKTTGKASTTKTTR